jgi:hypothetical protein
MMLSKVVFEYRLCVATPGSSGTSTYTLGIARSEKLATKEQDSHNESGHGSSGYPRERKPTTRAEVPFHNPTVQENRMFIGHYGAALVAKRVEPRVPLWALLLAVQIVDVFWAIFVLLGIESARLDPSLPSNPLVLSFMPFTHGLPATLVWALLGAAIGALWFARAGARARIALVLAAAVASHWCLDLIVHRPDLPLWGDSHKVGAGLWNFPAVALLLEIAIFIAAFLWSLQAKLWSAKQRTRLIALFAVILVVQLASFFGPAPPSIHAVVVSGLCIYLAVAAVSRWIEK